MDNAIIFLVFALIAIGITAPLVRRYSRRVTKSSRKVAKRHNGTKSYVYPLLILVVPPIYTFIYGALLSAVLTLQVGINTSDAIDLFYPRIVIWTMVTAALFMPFAVIMFTVIAAQRGQIRAPWLVRVADNF